MKFTITNYSKEKSFQYFIKQYRITFKNPKTISYVIVLLTSFSCFSQNLGINSTGAIAHPSAVLDVDASPTNNKGLLLPRIPLQATNIAAPVSSPATSLLVYNTATAGTGTVAVVPGYYYWDGTKWVALMGAASGANNAWIITGNAGTSAGTNFIGTTDAQDLVFKTNSIEKARILGNGNFGINTNTPSEKLDVAGNIKFNGALMPNNIAGSAGQVLTSSGAGIAPVWSTISTSGSNTAWDLSGNSGTTAGTNFLGTTDNQDLVFKTNSSEKARVSTNGNLGIGTTSPGRMLHLFSNNTDNQVMIETANTTLACGIRVNAGANGLVLGMSGFTNAWAIGSIIGDAVLTTGTPGQGICFGTSSLTKMYLSNAGDFGIGTTSPAFRLDVNGSAGCTSMAWTSDKRKKKNIISLNVNAVDLINKLNPVTYEWISVLDNGMKGAQMGFIAQELEEVLPSIVITANDENKSKSVKYNELIPLYAKAIQEQQSQIEELKKITNVQEQHIKALLIRIQNIEKL